MEYIKVDASFKDRLHFLISGLLNKKYVCLKRIKTNFNQTNIKSNNITQEENNDKIEIPFFELGKTTKSNLK